jgi:hypothetical protein
MIEDNALNSTKNDYNGEISSGLETLCTMCLTLNNLLKNQKIILKQNIIKKI